MAEGPFGSSGAVGKPLLVVHRGGGSGSTHPEPGLRSTEHQTNGSSKQTDPGSRRRASRLALIIGITSLFWVAGAIAAAATLPYSSPLWTDLAESTLFSESCTQALQASDTKDALTLNFGSMKGDFCRAEIVLKEPLPLNELSSILFEVQGTSHKQFVQIELRERTEDTIRSVKTKEYRVRDEWTSQGFKASFWNARRLPSKITSISFIVSPAVEGDPTLVKIRRIQLDTPDPAAMIQAETTPVIATTDTKPKGHVTPTAKASALATMPSIQLPSWQKIRNAIGQAGMTLFVLALLGFALKRKIQPRREGVLSPLYEINLRTWKSRRDGDGVVHIGGLQALTLEDLQDIRDAGFQSLWIMGLWEVGPRVRAMSKQYGDDFHGSPYAIYDYKVAQELGTDEELDRIVELAHRVGLGVVVDFVPNHMGIDSAWLNEHPEYFLHRLPEREHVNLPDNQLLQLYPGYFPYRTPAFLENGRRVPKTIMVAYGKDPHFFPWIDTAQLDYANPELRDHLIRMISGFAKRFDGIRCDMAMLVLREQVKIHRHPGMSWEHFNTVMPNEFWPEVIQASKKENPNFMFIAETYWALEGALQQMGFDYTYDKPLYESMCHAFQHGHAEGLMNFLRVLSTDYMRKSVHFLENHDEERAMNTLGEERQRPAAAMLCTLPGLALLHQGQLEGRRERLPVQRVVPLQNEKENELLSSYYKHLLHATSLPVFQEGRLHVLYCNNPAIISYVRGGAGQQALVVINTSMHLQRGNIFLTPGLRLESGYTYWLQDIYYDLKRPEIKQQQTVQPAYQYPASQLLKQGLYVELQPFDAHIFLVAPDRIREHKKKLESWLRNFNRRWELPRPARRLFGQALTRAVDTTQV